jgi:hypothetical protein
VKYAIFHGALLVLFCSSPATPAAPSTVPLRPIPPPAVSAPTLGPRPRLAASSLYSRRSRRLVQSYLRLKLLEAREADLDRARLVIERKLGIGALLGPSPPPPRR